jgi:ferredoxin-NADP reductase
MMKHRVTLLMNTFVTHDVRRLVVTRPDGFGFTPGQGVELAIDTPEWREQARPFTPTSLDADGVVEFTIKAYPRHEGVTQALHHLRPGASLQMSEPFGTINYKGPGVFIAGGAGITPFIAIMRELVEQKDMAEQHMIFSNRTPADIIYEKELRNAFDQRLQLTCTADTFPGYAHNRVDKAFLAEKINNFEQNFYVCGPPGLMEAVTDALQSLGAKSQQLVFEQ